VGDDRIVSLTRRRFIMGLTATAAGMLCFPPRARAADEFRIAFVPDVATSANSISDKQPFVDYFAKALGRPIKLYIPTNYAATVEAVGNDSVDLAHFGGLTYLKARERYGVIPIAQRVEDRRFHSVFITNAPAIGSLKDLRGKTFAFGDVNSTAGHLIAAKELLEAGVDPDKDLTARFSGNHTNTAIAVNSGQVVAGALDETVYRKMLADKTIDDQKARVFFTSKPFVDYVWTVRKEIDPALVGQVRAAFLGLTDPAVLAVVRGTKYVAASDAEYEPLRVVARKLNLL
jgi:phosphonate transport system substrate-binding protein